MAMSARRLDAQRHAPARLCAELPDPVGDQPALEGEAPTIDLVIGYSTANTSAILKLFLSKSDDLVSRVAHSCEQQ